MKVILQRGQLHGQKENDSFGQAKRFFDCGTKRKGEQNVREVPTMTWLDRIFSSPHITKSQPCIKDIVHCRTTYHCVFLLVNIILFCYERPTNVDATRKGYTYQEDPQSRLRSSAALWKAHLTQVKAMTVLTSSSHPHYSDGSLPQLSRPLKNE